MCFVGSGATGRSYRRLRLAEAERNEARKRLERFIDWSRTTPATRAYVEMADAAVAIAQHYGIATNLLDWSSDPRVALFFALDGKELADEMPIVFAARSEDIAKIDGCRIVKIHVPNLWRLEAQRGLFVEVTDSLAASELEAHCQAITFARPNAAIFDRSYFYPVRKSDLETRIDQFFPLDTVDETMTQLIKRVELFAMHRWHTYPGAFFGRVAPPSSEKWESDLPQWNVISVEPLLATLSRPDLALCIPQDGLAGDRHATLRNFFLSQKLLRNRQAHISFKVQWGSPPEELMQRANRALDTYWDGVRRLPFPDEAIAEGLATLVICIQEYLATGMEVNDAFHQLFGETVLVEFADFNGLNQATTASKVGFSKIINSTVLDKLTPYVRRRVSNDPIDIFSFIVDAELTCDLEQLAVMMAREMVPAQIADHFIQGWKNEDWDPIFEAPSFDPTHLGYLSTSRFRFELPFAVDPQPADTIYLFQDMTEDEIDAEILSAELARRSGLNDAFFLRVHGWIGDSRELWEIPEAVELLRRFAAHGGLSPLEVFEQMPARLEKKFDNPRSPFPPPLGSFSVWRIVNGHIGPDSKLTEENIQDFIEKFKDDLVVSNNALDSRVDEFPDASDR
jgi:hypothetical protein